MQKEIWKDLGFYEVSNFGNVLSKKFKIPRLLKPDISIGYKRVRINNKWVFVHRLVALSFIPNTENKPQVNHIDEDKLNNNVSNLEWVTNRENIEHSLTKKSMTKIKGVHKMKDNYYQCKVYFNGKSNYLGSTNDIEKAREIVNNFLILNNII